MIEHIRIQNFKSIRDVSVDLSPVTVLIGRSGVGKSNFLRAIRFLRNFLLTSEAAIEREGQWSSIYPFFGKSAPLSFDIRFKIPGSEEIFRYAISWRVHEIVPGLVSNTALDSESLSVSDRTIFAWQGSKWIHWPLGGTGPSSLQSSALSLFPTITEAVLAYTALTTSIGWHDFPSTVFVTPAPRERSKDAVKVEGLDDSANNYLNIVREINQNLRDQAPRRHLLQRIRQINPDVMAIELDSVTAPTKILVAHPVNGKPFPLNIAAESDGFRRYYAHLLAMYQTPSKLLLMFEEPENGIFPGALWNLAEEFTESSAAGRGQVLLTTHSPQLLDGFAPEAIRVVDLNPDLSTRIAPLDPAQISAVRDELLNPGELLTVTSPIPASAVAE